MPSLPPQTPSELTPVLASTSSTVESDPFVIEERRAQTKAKLEDLKPGLSPETWRQMAREQMLHWLKWVRVYDDLAPYFATAPKNHRIPLPVAFGAFFVYEPENTKEYWEVPLLLALLQGDTAVAQQAAGLLDIPLTPALLAGPFPPCAPAR